MIAKPFKFTLGLPPRQSFNLRLEILLFDRRYDDFRMFNKKFQSQRLYRRFNLRLEILLFDRNQATMYRFNLRLEILLNLRLDDTSNEV